MCDENVMIINRNRNTNTSSPVLCEQKSYADAGASFLWRSALFMKIQANKMRNEQNIDAIQAQISVWRSQCVSKGAGKKISQQ